MSCRTIDIFFVGQIGIGRTKCSRTIVTAPRKHVLNLVETKAAAKLEPFVKKKPAS